MCFRNINNTGTKQKKKQNKIKQNQKHKNYKRTRVTKWGKDKRKEIRKKKLMRNAVQTQSDPQGVWIMRQKKHHYRWGQHNNWVLHFFFDKKNIYISKIIGLKIIGWWIERLFNVLLNNSSFLYSNNENKYLNLNEIIKIQITILCI